MDFMTVGGLLCGFALLGWSAGHGGSLSAFVNLHGVGIVLGGTLCATAVSCSARDVAALMRAVAGLFLEPAFGSPETAIPRLVALCRKARQGGARAVQDAGAPTDDNGFTARVVDVCLTLGEKGLAQLAIEREINEARARHREVGNVLRTMGLLAPMFGLLGTLIGIIAVLRNLSDAAQAGPAMAVAISSAFYGILLANLFFVPAANKLRSRSIVEGLAKEVVMTGVLEIMFSKVSPLGLETELAGFLQRRRSEATAPDSTAAPAGSPAGRQARGAAAR